jgi:hypothetical protein
MERIDIYPVGFIRDVGTLDAHLANPKRWSRRAAWRTFSRAVARSWRRRNYWNGYLAEPYDWPVGLRRCGSGWTRGRALRSLHTQMRKAGL